MCSYNGTTAFPFDCRFQRQQCWNNCWGVLNDLWMLRYEGDESPEWIPIYNNSTRHYPSARMKHAMVVIYRHIDLRVWR